MRPACGCAHGGSTVLLPEDGSDMCALVQVQGAPGGCSRGVYPGPGVQHQVHWWAVSVGHARRASDTSCMHCMLLPVGTASVRCSPHLPHTRLLLLGALPGVVHIPGAVLAGLEVMCCRVAECCPGTATITYQRVYVAEVVSASGSKVCMPLTLTHRGSACASSQGSGGTLAAQCEAGLPRRSCTSWSRACVSPGCASATTLAG